MKKSRKCLKCDSLQIVWFATAGDPHFNDTLTYMCTDCGFYERHYRYPKEKLAVLQSDERYRDRFGWLNPSPERGAYR